MEFGFEGNFVAWQRFGWWDCGMIRRKICMMPSLSCHIYGIWDLEEQKCGGNVLNSLFWAVSRKLGGGGGGGDQFLF